MIHQYKMGGYNIVLDIPSGSVHLVDEVAYDIISLYESKSPAEITGEITKKYPDITSADVDECLSDIEELKAAGKLFAPPEYVPDL